MVREISGVKNLAQKLVGRVLDHLHLFDDDLLLALQIFARKSRVREHVRNKVKSFCHATVRDLHGKARHLVHGEGVEVAA